MLRGRASSAYRGLTHSCRSFHQRGSGSATAGAAKLTAAAEPPPLRLEELELELLELVPGWRSFTSPVPVPVPAAQAAPTETTLTAEAPKLLPRPPLLPLHTFTSPDIYSPTAARNSRRDLITSAAIRHRKTATLRATRKHFASRPFSTSRTTTATTAATMSSQGEWTGVKVRQTFFDFFAERGHTIGKYASPPPTTTNRPSNTWPRTVIMAMRLPLGRILSLASGRLG